MAIDPTFVGRRYPATPARRIEQPEIDAFAAAVGEPAGGDAPPTFAMLVAEPAWRQLFADPELGLALERTVHADQAFALVRPLRAGDEVTAQLEVTSVRLRGASAYVGIRVDLADPAGAGLGTAASTFVCALGES